MLKDHKVYITDWKNARTVPLSEGEFHLDDYVNYVEEFIAPPAGHLRQLPCHQRVPAHRAGAGRHVAHGQRGQKTPLSMTMMGGPIDARKSPTAVNNLAMNKSFEWFENNVIFRVPSNFPGAGRRVYPGFLQHTGFVAMNPDRHAKSHFDYFKDLIKGDDASTEAHRKFYDEYNAVLDMDADYYLETIRTVFQEFKLVNGTWDVTSPEGKLERVQAGRHQDHRRHDGGRRAGRHLWLRPDRKPHLRCAAACPKPARRPISKSRAQATTASSAAAAGATRCTRGQGVHPGAQRRCGTQAPGQTCCKEGRGRKTGSQTGCKDCSQACRQSRRKTCSKTCSGKDSQQQVIRESGSQLPDNTPVNATANHPLAQRIHAALPQTQCTRCGYPDCAAYAEVIASGEAAINQCPPGGEEGIQRLAAITGQPALPLNPANGAEGPRKLAVIDEDWCIGCTLCIKACPTDAILGANKMMHTVIEAHCTGCELCVPVCPVDCISLENASGTATGWAAWSPALAAQARDRYDFHRTRQARDALENDQRLEAKALAKLADLPAHTKGATGAEADRKKAVIEAALARARQRRDNG
jgi:RnfABCDGE-type electron transport complex B subunit